MIPHCTIYNREELRRYVARVEICEKYECCHRGLHKPESPVLQMVFEIPGVQSVLGRGYHVEVEKADSYSWDEIDPKVEEILEALNKASS